MMMVGGAPSGGLLDSSNPPMRETAYGLWFAHIASHGAILLNNIVATRDNDNMIE